jgi:hypothetical protein
MMPGWGSFILTNRDVPGGLIHVPGIPCQRNMLTILDFEIE